MSPPPPLLLVVLVLLQAEPASRRWNTALEPRWSHASRVPGRRVARLLARTIRFGGSRGRRGRSGPSAIFLERGAGKVSDRAGRRQLPKRIRNCLGRAHAGVRARFRKEKLSGQGRGGGALTSTAGGAFETVGRKVFELWRSACLAACLEEARVIRPNKTAALLGHPLVGLLGAPGARGRQRSLFFYLFFFDPGRARSR